MLRNGREGNWGSLPDQDRAQTVSGAHLASYMIVSNHKTTDDCEDAYQISSVIVVFVVLVCMV
jgi:hypothetical protein